jgi:gamma-glutamyltranspeptidase/glutathione hydrolase
MSPTLVTRNRKPVMTLGAAGGPTIITQVVQVLVNNLELGIALPHAVAAPRIHQQWRPDVLFVEKTMPDAVREALLKKGHALRDLGGYGSTQAIGLDDEGKFVSVAEPRLEERNRAP